jgi:hypothetical protein
VGSSTLAAMFEFTPTEVVGYLASALVVVSLSMSSVVKLRLISLCGSVTFVVYGSLIGAPPIVIANVVIAGINIWFLRNELGGHRDLGASVIPATAPFLADFLRYHQDEILHFQPTFQPPAHDDLVLLLTRDGLPAGVVAGRQAGSDLHVTLDFVLKPYRDSRLGGWLYGKGSAILRAQGIRRLTTWAGDDDHQSYVERVGFRPDGDQFVLDL